MPTLLQYLKWWDDDDDDRVTSLAPAHDKEIIFLYDKGRCDAVAEQNGPRVSTRALITAALER